jgi:hypothetical protein
MGLLVGLEDTHLARAGTACWWEITMESCIGDYRRVDVRRQHRAHRPHARLTNAVRRRQAWEEQDEEADVDGGGVEHRGGGVRRRRLPVGGLLPASERHGALRLKTCCDREKDNSAAASPKSAAGTACDVAPEVMCHIGSDVLARATGARKVLVPAKAAWLAWLRLLKVAALGPVDVAEDLV